MLRGLSILAVVLLHSYLRMFFAGFDLKPLVAPWLFHLLLGNGVTVFFAVSGFLIAYTSIERFGPLALWVLRMVLLTAPLGWLVAKYFSEPLNRRLRKS